MIGYELSEIDSNGHGVRERVGSDSVVPLEEGLGTVVTGPALVFICYRHVDGQYILLFDSMVCLLPLSKKSFSRVTTVQRCLNLSIEVGQENAKAEIRRKSRSTVHIYLLQSSTVISPVHLTTTTVDDNRFYFVFQINSIKVFLEAPVSNISC